MRVSDGTPSRFSPKPLIEEEGAIRSGAKRLITWDAIRSVSDEM